MSGGTAWEEFRCDRSDIFEKIQDHAWFNNFITFRAQQTFMPFGYLPTLIEWGTLDVRDAWEDDISRISNEDFEGGDLDHFKQSGHLCFWVRRKRVILECYRTEDEIELPEILKDVLLLYPNEYFGWEIGFKICRYFEAKRVDRRVPLEHYIPSANYIHNMCHFLSTKATSPHGVAMMYRSLFEGFSSGLAQ